MSDFREDEKKKNSSGALRIVRTKSLSIKKFTKLDVIDSKDIITYETSHQFFSTINSEKTLRLVINIIIEIVYLLFVFFQQSRQV